MASIQERLQLKRVPLDKWTVREQLCLASAVACSGDRNWMSVSRTLKIICGGNRPSDWFSQKSCAAQYGKLLENVETPKRKKRNEKDTTTISSVETPGECILRKLTQERVSELNKLIQDEHRDYTKTKNEILSIQSNSVEESKLHEMWTQTEIEKKQREKEQLQHAQWLKEREERKIEMERSLRPTALQLYQQQQQQQQQQQLQQQHHQNSPSNSPSKLNLMLKSEDMDIDDGNLRQGTSPLLTSLLKSPSPAPNSTNTLIHSSVGGGGGVSGTGGSSTATISGTIPSSRVVAPTITNLLTGSTSHHISSSTLTPSTSTSNSTFQLIQHSLTGPPPPPYDPSGVNNMAGGNTSTLVVAQSPSQAAPTLSMLLENKSKEQVKAATPLITTTTPSSTSSSASTVVNSAVQFEGSSGGVGAVVGINQTSSSSSTLKQNETYPTTDEVAVAQQIKDEDQQLMDVFNGLIPDNIDELADILTENNAIILNGELLEEESMLENVESLIAEQEGNLENVNISGEFSEGGGGISSSEDASTGIAGFQILQQSTQIAAGAATTTMTKTMNTQSDQTFSDIKISTDIKTENEEVKPTNFEHVEISPNEHPTKIEIKDDDQSSSDVSNDVPLASLLNTSEFDKKTSKAETKETIEMLEKNSNAGDNADNAAAGEVDGSSEEATEELKREGPDVFESDSNDDKCLESIKREIHGLSGLKDNNSDNSNDETQNKIELKTKTNEGVVTTKSEKCEIVDSIEPTDEVGKIIAISSADDKEMDRPLAGFSDGSPTTVSPTDSIKSEQKNLETESTAIDSSTANNSIETIKATTTTAAESAQPQETFEIVEIKDDKSDDDKQESFIIIEETDDTNSEENTSEEVKMETVNIKDDDDDDDDDNNDDDNEEEINKKSNASKNEDFFLEDKDAIEDAKGDDSESMSESKSVDQTITIIDTDDDSPIEVVKEDKIGKTKRDYSRRKTDSNVAASGSSVEKRQEEVQTASSEITTPTVGTSTTNKVSATVEEATPSPTQSNRLTLTNLNHRTTKLKENDQNRSESPSGGGGGGGGIVVNDDECNDSPLRSKRRYSSTPVIDSLPNSPASSDDRDYRAWKKSILMVLNRLNNHKYSNSFAKPITDEQLPGYCQIILRPMDLYTIKRNIDSGITRTTAEFERDLRLMCYNCFMFDCKELITEQMAQEFLKDALKNIDTVMEVWKKENEKVTNANDRTSTPPTTIAKTVRSRKSHRLPAN